MDIQGRWRITSMEQWEQEDVELSGPAIVNLTRKGGEMNFIALWAELDCRYSKKEGRPVVEFSWCGSDEGTEVCGRGRAELKEDDTLDGRIYFHQGDDSGFTANRCPATRVKKRG